MPFLERSFAQSKGLIGIADVLDMVISRFRYKGYGVNIDNDYF